MIAIISDVHGNHAALCAVLANIDAIGVDQIICLGDIGGYYCEINECCDTLRSRNIFSLMGNHDWYLVSDESCPRSNSATRCIEYQRTVITQSNLDWLATLKSQGEIDGLRMVHGGWKDPVDEYLSPSSEYFSALLGRFFVSGHTHVPCIWSDGSKSYCNPGSVGQPRDGNPDASFATWDGAQFALYRVGYDFKPLQDKMKMAGFEPYFYENLAMGSRIGGKIDTLNY